MQLKKLDKHLKSILDQIISYGIMYFINILLKEKIQHNIQDYNIISIIKYIKKKLRLIGFLMIKEENLILNKAYKILMKLYNNLVKI
jgi:hypothetical protein